MQNIVGITAYPYNNLRNGDTSALSGRDCTRFKAYRSSHAAADLASGTVVKSASLHANHSLEVTRPSKNDIDFASESIPRGAFLQPMITDSEPSRTAQ